jgi:lambda family phage portal protein
MPLTESVIVDPSLSVPATAPQPGRTMPAPRPLRRKAMGAALRRSAAAMATNPGGYLGAAQTRHNRDWIVSNYSGDSAIAAGWDNLTPRARDLVRNEPHAAQAVQRIVQNVVGPMGIGTEGEIEFDDGTYDDESNREIDRGFEQWMDEADAEGEMHFSEMQALAMSEAPEVGETFLVRVSKPDSRRLLPICYQVMEAEQINDTLDRPPSPGLNRIKRGIEYDRFGVPVAYHFWTEHPYDLQVSATDTVRVTADRVAHYFERRRPSQRRGVTWFAPILQVLHDLGEYVGSETTAARIASYFTVAIKRAGGGGSGLGFGDDGDATDGDGNALEELGPGIIADLDKDDDVQQIFANRPNAQAEPWIRLLLLSMANGLGMSYLGLTLDVAQANFSSARFARLGDKLFWQTLQGRFGRRVVLRVRRDVVTQLIAMGKIPSLSPSQFAANRRHWLATRLSPPGWEEVQVKDEVEAAILRIQAGLSTLQDETAGRGQSWRRVLKQRARELEASKDMPIAANVLPQKLGGTQPTSESQLGQESRP